MMNLRALIVAWLLCTCVQAQQVTTIAGSAGASGFVDGVGPVARFNEPHAVASDKNGNVLTSNRYPVTGADANGQIQLSETLQQGSYFVRALSTRMMNAGKTDAYKKELVILGKGGKALKENGN